MNSMEPNPSHIIIYLTECVISHHHCHNPYFSYACQVSPNAEQALNDWRQSLTHSVTADVRPRQNARSVKMRMMMKMNSRRSSSIEGVRWGLLHKIPRSKQPASQPVSQSVGKSTEDCWQIVQRFIDDHENPRHQPTTASLKSFAAWRGTRRNTSTKTPDKAARA